MIKKMGGPKSSQTAFETQAQHQRQQQPQAANSEVYHNW